MAATSPLRQRQRCSMQLRQRVSATRRTRPTQRSLVSSAIVTCTVLLLILPSKNYHHVHGQDVVVNRDPAAGGIPPGSVGNPLNKYCGISYEEAHRFCHLPIQQSLPCPNGDNDCAYDLPCWTLEVPCTMPPTPGPTSEPTTAITISPTHLPSAVPSGIRSAAPSISVPPTFNPTTTAPITIISSNPGDHNFCGLGYDNLFNCAVNCPNGSPFECPDGQLCYFNTPCDARLKSIEEEEERTEADDTGGDSETQVVANGETNEENVSVESQSIKAEEEKEDVYDPINDQKFCGKDTTNAIDKCSRETHCPIGDECPSDEYCFVITCSVADFPTFVPTPVPQPTISPKPTDERTPMPTITNPDATDLPTLAELDPDDIRNFFWCGIDWGDASERCHLACVDGFHSSCPKGEECFANVSGCKGKKKKNDDSDVEVEKEDDGAAAPRTTSPDGSTWSPTVSPPPITEPVEDDKDSDEEGGDDADEEDVEAARTPSPDGSTWSPTITPPQMVITNDTILNDEESLLPTASPLLADDYRLFFYCGKNWTDASTRCHKWCKSGFHTECDEDEECFAQADCQGEIKPETLVPTISPVPTVSPTTATPSLSVTEIYNNEYSSNLVDMSMSLSMSMSDSSTSSSIPTLEPLTFDIETELPTIVSALPTIGNVDEMEFAPDDPAGYFFCGTDWNHAITDCPHRCPTGEASQCPDGLFCYAFTPCVGIGGVAAPGMAGVKPTYEPTPAPISIEPTTTAQYWDAQNEAMNNNANVSPPPASWTETPATYAPTGDHCRGEPCDYKGECRSELGFCGEGIVFCNSKSSWVQNCGGGGLKDPLLEVVDDATSTTSNNSNGEPTAAPLTLWESWVAKRDGQTTTGIDEVDGFYNGGSEVDNPNIIPISNDWDNWAMSSESWIKDRNSVKEETCCQLYDFLLLGAAILFLYPF